MLMSALRSLKLFNLRLHFLKSNFKHHLQKKANYLIHATVNNFLKIIEFMRK